MTRDALRAILSRATGLTEKGGAFRVAPDTRVQLYLGSESGGIAVHEVSSIALHDAFVEIAAPEPGLIFSGYEAVQAVMVKPPKDAAARAGFA